MTDLMIIKDLRIKSFPRDEGEKFLDVVCGVEIELKFARNAKMVFNNAIFAHVGKRVKADF